MEKQQIIDIAKDQGLDLAEDMAVAATRAAIKLLREILPKVSKGFGFAFSMFIDAYEPAIFEMIDRIDGKKG